MQRWARVKNRRKLVEDSKAFQPDTLPSEEDRAALISERGKVNHIHSFGSTMVEPDRKIATESVPKCVSSDKASTELPRTDCQEEKEPESAATMFVALAPNPRGRQLTLDDWFSCGENGQLSVEEVLVQTRTASNPLKGQEKLFDKFENYILVDQNRAKSTCDAYLGDLRLFCVFLEPFGILLLDAKTKDIDAFLKDLSHKKRCDRTVWRKLESLKRFYGMLCHDKDLRRDPTLGLKIKKTWRNVSKALNAETINEILDKPRQGVIGVRDTAMFYTMYGTGIRVDEARNIKISDINLESRSLHIYKAKREKERIVAIAPEAVEAIEIYLNNARDKLVRNPSSTAARKDLTAADLRNPQTLKRPQKPKWLFVTNSGNRISKSNIRARVKLASSIATPHCLRHSFTTDMKACGAKIEDLQRQLGHEDPETTKIYLGPVSDEVVQMTYQSFHPRARKQ